MKTQIKSPICDKCTSILGNFACALTLKQPDTTTERTCSLFKKGQFIFNEGNSAAGVFCINKGKVKLFQTGEMGKEQIFSLAKEGDMLGYRTMICGDTYSVSASVMEDSIICFIPKTTFFEFLLTNSEFSAKMMKILSHDLKDAENRLTGIAQKSVRSRIAEAILMLSKFYGADEEGLINSSISREDIANIVGTATETTIRILSYLSSEELIELKGRKIKVKNQIKLEKAAH